MLPWPVQALSKCVEPVRKRLTGSGVLVPRGTPDNPDYEVTDFGKALASSHMGLTLGTKVLEVSRLHVSTCVVVPAKNKNVTCGPHLPELLRSLTLLSMVLEVRALPTGLILLWAGTVLGCAAKLTQGE